MSSRPRARIARALVEVAGAALLLAASPALGANGPMPTTVGPKGPVTLAVDGDAHALFRMPSAVAWSLDHRVELDVFLVFGASEMRNTLNDFDRTDTIPGATFAAILAPGRDLEEEEGDGGGDGDGNGNEAAREAYGFDPSGCVTLGFGVFVDMAGGGGDRSRVRTTTFPETVGITEAITFVSPSLSATFAPAPWLGLGATLHVTSASSKVRTFVGGGGTPLDGSPQFNGFPIPGDPTYADFLGLFRSDTATDATTLFSSDLSGVYLGATASLSLRPIPDLGIGLSYRPQSWAPDDLRGDATIDAQRTLDDALAGLSQTFRDLFLQTLPDRGANGFVSDYDARLEGITVPRQVRLGLCGWPHARVVLATEVAWVDWHRAFRTSKITLKDGTNRDLNFIVGSNRIVTRQPLRWRNTWIVSGYAAFAATDWLTLRAGVSHAESPLNPRTQDLSPTLGYVSTTLSLGASVRLGPVEVSLLLEHAFRASENSGPAVSSATGRNTTFASEQTWLHFGLAATF